MAAAMGSARAQNPHRQKWKSSLPTSPRASLWGGSSGNGGPMPVEDVARVIEQFANAEVRARCLNP